MNTSVSDAPIKPLMSRKLAIGLGSVALISGLALVGVRIWLNSSSEPALPPALEVATVTVQPEPTYTVAREYTGEVAAGRTSELGFEQGGELVEVLVDRGEFVNLGEPLARLDTRRLAAQRSQLVAQRDRAMAQLAELQNGPRREDIATAQATVQDLERQLDLERLRTQRRETLYTEGAISREDRDIVAFGASALQERLAAARSQLAELQTGTRPEQIAAQQATVQQLSAQIADLDIAIEKNTLFAPFSGTIADRRVDEGTILQAGQTVLRLVEQVSPEVEVGLPVEVVATLRLGKSQLLAIAGKTYPATVRSILPEVNATTRTQTVVFQVQGLGDRTLPPEQLAKVKIAQTVAMEGTWLPLTALVKGDRGLWAVYALKPAKAEVGENRFQVERRQVELLHTEGDQAFVRGVVNQGDRIVAESTQRLVPGQIVQISKGDS